MRWDRIVACCLIICGVGYASYSGVTYLQKIDVVEEVGTEELKPLTGQTEKNQKSSVNDNKWIIVPKKQRPTKGEKFGYLIIPRLKERIPIIEGTNENELAKGVGHYARSVLPGEPDNSVLSGHRDTVLRRLGEVKQGDSLHVKTAQGTFVYQVSKTWITDANDQSVIIPHDNPILTLTTCYPFGYFGSAPERYIIQSKLVTKMN